MQQQSPQILSEKIRKQIVTALADYQMLKSGDKVLMAVSGGKDSTILLLLLDEIKKRAPFAFDYQAIMIDQKQPGFRPDEYLSWLREKAIEVTLIQEDTYSIVRQKVEPGKTFCGLCSRLRRGILYTYAQRHGFTKIALGHHRDDINETLLLNLFYGGTLASMPPKLRSDDGKNTVIRPLAYVPESWLINYAKMIKIPVIPCNLCGSQENLRRKQIKGLLSKLQEDAPQLGASMIAAQQNCKPSQLLDRNLFDFHSI